MGKQIEEATEVKTKIEIDSYTEQIIVHTKAKKIKESWHGHWMARICLLLARLRNPSCEVALLTNNGTRFAVVVYEVTERVVYPDEAEVSKK